MSESGKQVLLLIAITVCLVLVLNPNALSSINALGRRQPELPRRVLSAAEMQQFTTTANTGEIVMVGSNGVLIDQGTQALRVGTADVSVITAGLERLRVSNSGAVGVIGNLGVGTTAPTSRLHVDGDIASTTGSLVNFGGALKTINSDLGFTAASFVTTSLPTGVQGGTISATYRLTALSSQASMAMNISGFTYIPGATYKYTFTTMGGSVPLSMTVLQGTSTGVISNNPVTNSITTSDLPITGYFTTANTGGNLAFNFQAASANPIVNWSGFTLTRVDTEVQTNLIVDGKVGVGTTNPICRTSIAYPGGNDTSTAVKYNFGLQVHNTFATGANNRSNLILFTDKNSTQGAVGAYRRNHDNNYTGGLMFLVGSEPAGFIQGTPGDTAGASVSLTEAMRINESGSVGIGTTNPGRMLHLYKETGGDEMRISSSAVEYGMGITSDNGNAFLYTRTNHGILFGTNNAHRMTLSGDGNLIINQAIGIGTLNPAEKLDVNGGLIVRGRGYGNNYSETYALNVSCPDSTNGDGGSVIYSNSINLKAGDLTWWNGGEVRSRGCQIRIGGGRSTMGSIDHSEIRMYTGGSERVTILGASGNVGIGTNNPKAPLHVHGSSGVNSGQTSYLWRNGVITAFSSAYYNVSIYATSSIATNDSLIALDVSSWSDIRIKKNIQPKSGLLDLANRINLYSYDHIDASKGQVEVGVIAQEVREIMPSMIKQAPEFLPNIYKEASSHSSSGDMVRLYVENKTSDGEELQLVFLKDGMKKTHADKIINCSREWIDIKKWGDYEESLRLFVYGTKDEEVLSVDKIQLGLIALGGVKELVQENQKLKQQVDQQQQAMIQQQQAILDLNTRLQRLEFLLSR